MQAEQEEMDLESLEEEEEEVLGLWRDYDTVLDSNRFNNELKREDQQRIFT